MTPPGHSLLSREFPRQEYWSGLPFPSLGIFPAQGSNLRLPHWQADSLPLSHAACVVCVVRCVCSVCGVCDMLCAGCVCIVYVCDVLRVCVVCGMCDVMCVCVRCVVCVFYVACVVCCVCDVVCV